MLTDHRRLQDGASHSSPADGDNGPRSGSLQPSQQHPDLGSSDQRSFEPQITDGTGKSHFTEGLAQAAIEKDLRVAWFTLETLSAAISKSKVDGSTARTVARIRRADLIVIDDIGLLPVGEDAAEAFYRIIDAAYERRSIAVTSNIHPSKAHMFRRTRARCCRSITGSRWGLEAAATRHGLRRRPGLS
ncbi:ATP-binding protein [Streptomyces orinoci]|uniref:ATP-binding protein n=1 Tax=Streptomyces orinoci TaxID=67339 RepID=A0ABV3K0R9_STRON|nr:ATP-binding protein [Streptomyces orinoci]